MLSSIENEREQDQGQQQAQQQQAQQQGHDQDPFRERSSRRSHVPPLDSSAGRLLMVEVAATIKFFISKFSFVRAAFCFHTTSLSCNYGMGNDVRDGIRNPRGSSTSGENDSRMSPRSLLLHALYTSAPAPSTSASAGDPASAPRSRSGSGSISGSRNFLRVSHSMLLSPSLSTFIPFNLPCTSHPLTEIFFFFLLSYYFPFLPFFFLLPASYLLLSLFLLPSYFFLLSPTFFSCTLGPRECE